MNWSMKFAATIAGALAFVMSAGALAFFAARYVNFDEVSESKPRQKHYRETLVEGLAVNRHGLYGVDLVRCRSCRVEKRKKGIFTLGGFNVLVIDDLDIILPPEEGCERPATEGDGDSPRSMARRMGVSDSFLSARGMPISFSGLKINGLSVGRLTAENKPEPAFAAKSAKAVRGGLELSGCVVYDAPDESRHVSNATLAYIDRKLRLTWDGGEMDLN